MREDEQVVQIDEHNLDRECIRLPSDYLRYAHQAAEAKRDLDEHKAHLDVIEADYSRRIRETPGRYGLEKITEGGITATILLQKDYQKKLQEVRDAQHQVDLAQAVVWALEHKKRTLTLLVELHGMGYFSEPKISAEGRRVVQEMTKKAVRRYRDDT